MNQRLIIIKLFDYFYNKIYKTEFKLDENKNRQGKVIDSFLKLLDVYFPGADSVGVNLLIQYFAWSFNYRFNQDTKIKISLNWIIGKKTLQKFLNRNTDGDFYVNAFLTEHNIVFDDIHQSLYEEELIAENLDPAEENEKLRFHGEARLYNCLQNTTMYNHRSINCIGCESKSFCKKMLKQKFPRTYKKRGYE